MRTALGIVLLGMAAMTATAQSCPKSVTEEAAAQSTLHGTLRAHTAIRDWTGLHLDRPACGENVVQLVFVNKDAEFRYRDADRYGGCMVTVKGKLYYPGTVYYSANLAMSDAVIIPDPACKPAPSKPDLTEVKINPRLESYRVKIIIDHTKDEKSIFVTTDDAKKSQLKPWGAYVSLNFNGAEDYLFLQCSDEFEVRNARGWTPKKRLKIVTDQNDFGLDDAAVNTSLTGAFVQNPRRRCSRSAFSGPVYIHPRFRLVAREVLAPDCPSDQRTKVTNKLGLPHIGGTW